jgi:hypothetical protein
MPSQHVPSCIVISSEDAGLSDRSKAARELLFCELELFGCGLLLVLSGSAVVLAGISAREGSKDVSMLHSSIESILFQHYIKMFITFA